MFDWCSGVCVWSDDATTKEHFGGYPIQTGNLPIFQELAHLLNKLVVQYDTALNWDNPGGALLWDKSQQAIFAEMARSAYGQLCMELGSDYEIFFYPLIF